MFGKIKPGERKKYEFDNGTAIMAWLAFDDRIAIKYSPNGLANDKHKEVSADEYKAITTSLSKLNKTVKLQNLINLKIEESKIVQGNIEAETAKVDSILALVDESKTPNEKSSILESETMKSTQGNINTLMTKYKHLGKEVQQLTLQLMQLDDSL